MRNRSVKLFFKSMIIFSVTAFVHAVQYAPVVELNFKGGNKRHIGRLGSLVPLYSQDDFIAYTALFAMKDSKNALEGNLGLGGRKIFDNSLIIGLYGFGDIRRSRDGKHPMYQVNAGLELFTEHLEFRVNGYIPITDRVPLSGAANVLDVNYSPAKNATIERRYNTQTNEVVLQGYDIDIGGNTNLFPQLSTYVAFFHFYKDKLSQRGVRLRSDYSVRDWVSLGFEINYDNKRKWYNYLDVKLQYHFDGKKNRRNSLTALQKKMTLLPVRDIDEVTLSVDDVVEAASTEREGKAVYFVEGNEGDIKGLDKISKNSTVIFLGSPNATEEAMKALKEYSNIVVLRTNGTSYPLIRHGRVNELTEEHLLKMMNKFKVYIPAKDAGNRVMRRVAKSLNSGLAPDVVYKVRRMGVDCKKLVDNGVNVKQLRNAGIRYYDMIKEKVTVKTIKDHTGADLKDLLYGGVPVSVLKAQGNSYNDMVNDGVKVGDLHHISGVSIQDMLDDNVPLSKIILSARAVENLTYMSLMNGGISASDIVNCDLEDDDGNSIPSVSYSEMRSVQHVSAGYLKFNQGVNSNDLVESGLTPRELYEDGISAYDMDRDDVSLRDVTNGAKPSGSGPFSSATTTNGIALSHVLEANASDPSHVITTKKIRDAKVFDTKQMLNRHLTVQEIHDGGVTYNEMNIDGVSLESLKEQGVTPAALCADNVDLVKIIRVYGEAATNQTTVGCIPQGKLNTISRMDYLTSAATETLLPNYMANPLNDGLRNARGFVGRGIKKVGDYKVYGCSLRGGYNSVTGFASGLGVSAAKSRLGQTVGLGSLVNWLNKFNSPYSNVDLVT